MFYAIKRDGKKILVMVFWSDHEREEFIWKNRSEKIEAVDETNQYVFQALQLNQPFPIIINL